MKQPFSIAVARCVDGRRPRVRLGASFGMTICRSHLPSLSSWILVSFVELIGAYLTIEMNATNDSRNFQSTPSFDRVSVFSLCLDPFTRPLEHDGPI